MSSAHQTVQPLTLAHCKRIIVVLPDNGTDRHLMRALYKELGITRVESVAIRAIATLREAKARKGRLPEAELARVVAVIVDAAQADAVFNFIHSAANIDQPGGGFIAMERLLGALPFVLPKDVPDERD